MVMAAEAMPQRPKADECGQRNHHPFEEIIIDDVQA